jgi:cytochrome o ubiquinol oxidase subunit 2
MMLVAGILLSIAIPSLFLFYFTAWKYRETNPKAKYEPNKRHGKGLNFTVWTLPFMIMLVLATIMWTSAHKLDPRRQLTAGVAPMTIQVISLRWKWLFIYPEQNIATVNFVQLPVDKPVQFELTADEAPMSSFWIPNLAGQLYTMTGHVNRLNTMAETAGDYPGSSAEINGAGFAGMKFTARASDVDNFDLWVQEVKKSTNALDYTAYANLLKPSESNPPAFYSSYVSNLYESVLLKYGGHNHSL